LAALPGLDLDGYRKRLLHRYANPALQHQTRQIAMDGSQKLPQRLLGTVRDRLRVGAPIDRLALAVAGWIHYLGGVDELGQRHEVSDPLAAALAQQRALAQQAAAGIVDAMAAERQRVETFCAFTPVFGDLSSEPRFVHAVAGHTLALRERGVLATVKAAT
jgi:fructuronate reductase